MKPGPDRYGRILKIINSRKKPLPLRRRIIHWWYIKFKPLLKKYTMKDFFKDLKNQIVAGIGVVMATLGTLFIDTVKEKLGLADEEPEQTEQVVQQPAQPEIIINIPEQKPAETKTIIKEVPAKVKPKKTETEKRKDEGLDW